MLPHVKIETEFDKKLKVCILNNDNKCVKGKLHNREHHKEIPKQTRYFAGSALKKGGFGFSYDCQN